jgi:hypothetical protein
MTGPEYDAEFEAFLKRRSPMHRRLSDIDHAEPSLELDRLVLTRAREAIESPRQPPMFRTSRWALPVGLAAAILIAFTVVLNIDRHGSDTATAVEKKAAAPAALAKRSEDQQQADGASTSPETSRFIASSNALTSNVRVAPPPATTRPAAQAQAAPAAGDPHASPESWLREINRLRAAGKTADADRELAAFRQAYPTHPAYSVAKPPAR